MLTFGERKPGVAYPPRPGAYALIGDREGRVLVMEASDGFWLPGGGIEPGESAEQALVREILEETGHTATVLRPLGEARQFAFEPKYDSHFEKLCRFFAARLGPRRQDPVEADHVMRWLAPDAARATLSHESQAWVISLLRG